MPLRVYHAGGGVRRRVFRLVLVDVRGQCIGLAAAGAGETGSGADTGTAAGHYTARETGSDGTVRAGRRVVRPGRPHARRLPHAGQPVERRRFRPFD